MERNSLAEKLHYIKRGERGSITERVGLLQRNNRSDQVEKKLLNEGSKLTRIGVTIGRNMCQNKVLNNNEKMR